MQAQQVFDETKYIVENTIVLSWKGEDPDGDVVTYDIYFSIDNPPLLIEVDHPESTYKVYSLEYDTKYYWQIVSRDIHGAETAGEVWVFTTEVRP